MTISSRHHDPPLDVRVCIEKPDANVRRLDCPDYVEGNKEKRIL